MPLLQVDEPLGLGGSTSPDDLLEATLFIFRRSNKFDAELGALYPSHCGQSNVEWSLPIRQEQTQLQVLACSHPFLTFQETAWKRKV